MLNFCVVYIPPTDIQFFGTEAWTFRYRSFFPLFKNSFFINRVSFPLFVPEQDGEQGKEGHDSKADREEGNRGDGTAD